MIALEIQSGRMPMIFALALFCFFVDFSICFAESGGFYVRAKAAMDNLDYQAARRELDNAIQSGENSPQQLASIYFLAAIVEGSFHRRAKAVDYFRRALAIDRSLTLPEGLSPKITKPFVEAQESIDESSLWVGKCFRSDDREISVNVNDSVSLVKNVEADVSYGNNRRQLLIQEARTSIVFKTRVNRMKRVIVRFVDEFGNEVLVPCKLEFTSEVVSEQQVKHIKRKNSFPSWYRSWKTWGIASLGLSIATLYWNNQRMGAQEVLNEQVLESENYEFSQVKDIEKQGSFETLMTNVFLGSAATAALLTTYLWFTESTTSSSKKVKLDAKWNNGGVTLVYVSHF